MAARRHLVGETKRKKNEQYLACGMDGAKTNKYVKNHYYSYVESSKQ